MSRHIRRRPGAQVPSAVSGRDLQRAAMLVVLVGFVAAVLLLMGPPKNLAKLPRLYLIEDGNDYRVELR